MNRGKKRPTLVIEGEGMLKLVG